SAPIVSCATFTQRIREWPPTFSSVASICSLRSGTSWISRRKAGEIGTPALPTAPKSTAALRRSYPPIVLPARPPKLVVEPPHYRHSSPAARGQCSHFEHPIRRSEFKRGTWLPGWPFLGRRSANASQPRGGRASGCATIPASPCRIGKAAGSSAPHAPPYCHQNLCAHSP